MGSGLGVGETGLGEGDTGTTEGGEGLGFSGVLGRKEWLNEIEKEAEALKPHSPSPSSSDHAPSPSSEKDPDALKLSGKEFKSMVYPASSSFLSPKSSLTLLRPCPGDSRSLRLSKRSEV